MASSSYGCARVLGLLLLAGPALAQSRGEATLAAARQLGQEGVTLYEQGDYGGAVEKLERAYTVVKVPTLGLWSGRALEKAGKLVEASQRYREVTLIAIKASDPALFRSAQADAQKGYDALAERIPQLTVEVKGATADDVSVTIDGNAVPSALIGAAVPANPGACKVEGRRGEQVVKQEVTLREGERQALTLTFSAAPSPAEAAATMTPAAGETGAQANEGATSQDQASTSTPVTKRWWFWTGLGAVVLGGTAVALAVALGGHGGGQQPLYQGNARSVNGP